MKQKPQPLHPLSLASATTILTTAITIFTTATAIALPNLKTITPLLEAVYGPLGYSLTIPGAILGTTYVGIDTFILTYLFAIIYNKLL